MHLTRDDLHGFFSDRLGAADRRRVVRHLVSGCAACGRLASEISGGKAPLDYGGVFTNLSTTARMLPGRLQSERMLAQEQWAYLRRHSPQQRLLRVENDPRFSTFGLHARLLEAARQITPDDPQEATIVARLALAVAERLDERVYGRGSILEVRAATMAALGNAQRSGSNFAAAAESFARAEQLIRENTADPLEIAYLQSLKASLQIDLEDFAQALETIDSARRIYERLGDRHQVGRMDVQEGLAVGYRDPARGIERLARARSLIEYEREPRLLLAIWHSTAIFLCNVGSPGDALALVRRSQRLYRRFDDLAVRLRLRWVEGKINLGLGRTDEAETILSQAAETALRHGFRREHDLMRSELNKL